MMNVEFNARRVALLVLVVGVAVILLGYAREFVLMTFGDDTFLGDLRHIALMDSPFRLSKWYESGVLLYVSGLIAASARFVRKESKTRVWRSWNVLSGLFLVLSLDKSINVHQLPLGAIEYLGGSRPFTLWFPALPAIAIAAYVMPVLLSLKRSTALQFLACGIVFVVGAIGLDVASATLGANFGIDSKLYVVSSSLEETLEVLGSVFFCWVLTSHFVNSHSQPQ